MLEIAPTEYRQLYIHISHSDFRTFYCRSNSICWSIIKCSESHFTLGAWDSSVGMRFGSVIGAGNIYKSRENNYMLSGSLKTNAFRFFFSFFSVDLNLAGGLFVGWFPFCSSV